MLFTRTSLLTLEGRVARFKSSGIHIQSSSFLAILNLPNDIDRSIPVLKNEEILVVTVARWGGHPNLLHPWKNVLIYIVSKRYKQKNRLCTNQYGYCSDGYNRICFVQIDISFGFLCTKQIQTTNLRPGNVLSYSWWIHTLAKTNISPFQRGAISTGRASLPTI